MPTELAPVLSAHFFQELEGARRRVAALEEANRAIQYLLDRLARLSAFSQGLEETTSIASVSDLLFEELQGIFAGAGILMALLEEEGPGLRIAHVLPPTAAGAAQGELAAQMASGVVAWALRQRRSTMVPAAHLEGRLVLMPLVTARRTVGMLMVATTLPEGAVEQQHLTLAAVVARQAAECIDNLCLTEDLRRQNDAIRSAAEAAVAERTRQLEAVRAVSQEITRELDLPVLLSLITRRAAELVGAESGVVYLWDEAAEVLIPKAWHGLGDWMREVRLRRGEGIAGTVMERRAGLTLNDYRSSPHAHPLFLERTGITAVVAEPLLYRDRFVGVIAINNEGTGRTFTEQDRETLTLLATQAAIAIENARLYEATKRAAREARSLYEVAHSLTTSLEPTEVLHLISVKTTELLGTPHAQVVLWDEATQTLRLGAAYGTEAERVKSQVFRLGDGVNGIVAQTRAPLLVNDYQAFPHRVKQLTHLVAVVGVPLLYRDRLLGVLTTHAAQLGAVFTSDHLDLLTSFADQAATAIENARLYEDLRRRMAEQHRAVTRLVNAKRMASAGFIAGGIAHDINNPLCTISNYIQVLRFRSQGLPPEVTSTLDAIEAAVQRIARKIQELLDFVRRRPEERTAFDLNEMVKRLLLLIQGNALFHPLRMTTRLDPDLPLVELERVAWEQVLLELLTNARNAVRQGGSVCISTRRVDADGGQLVNSSIDQRGGTGRRQHGDELINAELDHLTTRPGEGEWVEVVVEDDGPGIAPEDLARIFDPCFTTKGSDGILGLGLGICRDIVAKHGGSLRLESDGASGTRVIILLPAARPPRQSSDPRVVWTRSRLGTEQRGDPSRA